MYKQYLSTKSDYDEQINLDIHRTFSFYNAFKQKDMQDKLRRVLHAISCKNPYVGYVQGMNFLAGFLLLNYSEEDSFKLFIRFLEEPKYDLYGLYINGFPKLHLSIFQIEQLCKKYLPTIHNHFLKLDVKSQHWLLSWLLTLFLKNIKSIGFNNYKILFREFYRFGWNVLIRFIIIMLKNNQQCILDKKNFSDLLTFLLEDIWKITDFRSMSFLISESKIIKNDELYMLELKYVMKTSSNEINTSIQNHQQKHKKKYKTGMGIFIGVSATALAIAGGVIIRNSNLKNKTK